MGLSIREKTVNNLLMAHMMLYLIGIKEIAVEIACFMKELIVELVESDQKGNWQW
jgi:hypothetical protein